MHQLLWLIPIIPFAGFLLLLLAGFRFPRRWVAWLGVGATGLAAVIAVLVGITFIVTPPSNGVYTQTLWTWMSVGNLVAGITFSLDALSVVMMLVVTVIGLLILVYSAEFMAAQEGYHRFFAYMNLFVGSMLVLVLADNLLLLYLGWEGVGLCSYLLIGFWYTDPANIRAAMKAFIVTRIGDATLAVGLLLLFTNLGTLQIHELLQRAATLWAPGSGVAIAAAALLLAGAVGKSAQLPLQTWLPDAMAGPTPVSALIHAATMVTAGVYLIARMHGIFQLAPSILALVAVIGAVTLVLAACSALVQTDIKRVLAYSTISQVGYMFLALGVGAWSFAILHFMTHACFKALLFLAAGVVIMSLREEHDIYKMGGLRKKLPLTFWTFLIGALSLSAFPLLTAGFYSKDLILYATWVSVNGSPWLWAAGWIGAILTALYAFRLVFLIFWGAEQTPPTRKPGIAITLPLVILAVLAATAGLLELPRTLGNHPYFTNFLQAVLPPVAIKYGAVGTEIRLQLASEAASISGIVLAYLLFLRSPHFIRTVAATRVGSAVQRCWYGGWGFDWLYDGIVVRPFMWLTQTNRDDVLDYFYRALALLLSGFHALLSKTQTGQVRWYVAGVATGAVILIALLVLL